MRKALQYIMCFLPLPLSAVLAGLMIRRMDVVMGWAGSIFGMSGRLLEQVLPVLSQLRDAEIAFAWLPVLLAGSMAGVGLFFLRSKVGWVLLWPPVLLALTAASFWFAIVNGVQVGKLLSCLIPMLPGLL